MNMFLYNLVLQMIEIRSTEF